MRFKLLLVMIVVAYHVSPSLQEESEKDDEKGEGKSGTSETVEDDKDQEQDVMKDRASLLQSLGINDKSKTEKKSSILKGMSGGMDPLSGGMGPMSGGFGAMSGGMGSMSGGMNPMSGGMGPMSGGMGALSGGMGPMSGGIGGMEGMFGGIRGMPGTGGVPGYFGNMGGVPGYGGMGSMSGPGSYRHLSRCANCPMCFSPNPGRYHIITCGCCLTGSCNGRKKRASIVPSKGLLSSGRQGPSTGTIGGILAGLIENGVIDGGAVYEVFRCMGCSSQCQQGAFECGCCATGTCQGK